MFQIDLNCDLGESFGSYKIGLDQDILEYVTSANIACGFHAGDPSVMRKTVALAAEKGVKIGAHPACRIYSVLGAAIWRFLLRKRMILSFIKLARSLAF